MGAHRHQVATLLLNPFDDFLDWFAVRKFGFRWNAGDLKLGPDFFQVSGVFCDFGTHGIPAIGSGCPSIGHMKQYQVAASELRKLLDMFDNCPVARGSVEGHENFFIHGFYPFDIRGYARSASSSHPPVMTRQAALSESGRA